MARKRSKRFRAVSESPSDDYLEPQQALERAVGSATAKFDESIEVHLSTFADPRHADQTLREVLELPHSLGSVVRVVVFAEGDAARIATEAGADHVVDDALLERITGGWTDWDVSLATPDQMPKLGRLGRVLGPRGLMPNPRNGTVVAPDQIAGAIASSKRGRSEIRMDRLANLHSVIGRRSFDLDQLTENLRAVYFTVTNAKPDGVKGPFLKSASVCSTMGPSYKISLSSLEAF